MNRYTRYASLEVQRIEDFVTIAIERFIEEYKNDFHMHIDEFPMVIFYNLESFKIPFPIINIILLYIFPVCNISLYFEISNCSIWALDYHPLENLYFCSQSCKNTWDLKEHSEKKNAIKLLRWK